jgi:uncharacterized integral membrane protein (TIGR00697 family)
MIPTHQTTKHVQDEPLDRKTIVLFLCVSVFVGALLISNITASKLYDITVFGFVVTIPVGTSLFALTFFATDVTSEVWGKKYSALLIVCGLAMRVFSLLFLSFAVFIPPAPFWTGQEAYASVLTGSGRILLAGILTYPVSQLTDVFVFHKLKQRHRGKNMLWFRNLSSTFCSQTVDSAVFICLAFAATTPLPILGTMIVGQVVIKWAIAFCDTPFVYMARNFAYRRPLWDIRG